MATQSVKSLPAITLAEVARVRPFPSQFERETDPRFLKQHNTEANLWLAINGNVYDLSKFVQMHPGGAHTLLAENIAGCDATEAFFSLHRSEVLAKYSRFIVATIAEVRLRFVTLVYATHSLCS